MEQPISAGICSDKISVTSTQQLRKPGQKKTRIYRSYIKIDYNSCLLPLFQSVDIICQLAPTVNSESKIQNWYDELPVVINLNPFQYLSVKLKKLNYVGWVKQRSRSVAKP